MSLRTPLGRVLGLGAAGDGTGHWWQQRVTAVALLPLGLWLVVGIAALDTGDRAAVTDWAGAPLNAALLILLVLSAAWHSMLGTRVIAEDYLDGGVRVATVVLLQFLHWLAAVVGVLAVLRMAVGGQ
jgi:succinate dehydrogenase / fumarate reductase membrane anchor subunit